MAAQESPLTSGFAKINLDDNNKDDSDEKMNNDLIERMRNSLEKYDFPQNWILDQESFDSTAKIVYEELSTNKMNELAEESDEAELKCVVLKNIGNKLTHIFLGIYLNKFDKVGKLLEDCKALIRHFSEERKYISVDYLPGIHYCLKGLEGYLVTKLPRADYSSSKIQLLFDQLGSLEDLKQNGRGYVGLLAMKQSFMFQMYRKGYKAQDVIIREMIKLDPESGEWNLWLHNILRFQRRDIWNNDPPGREEIELIIKAAQLSPNNPLSLTGLCEAVAEFLKDHGPYWNGLADFGPGRVFHSSEEMVNYLQEETRHVLDLDPMSVKTNISVAQIFTVALPRKFRDFSYAKLCIERALLFHPNSSKANGRMAEFCLTVNEDTKEAEKCFEHSLQADPWNFPTLICLLQTYMANVEVNGQKIEALLHNELLNTGWSEPNRGSLYFVKGVYGLLRGNTDKAIENWIIAVGNFNYPVRHFKRLEYFRNRYRWPEESISLEAIYTNLSRSPKKFSLSERLTLDSILQSIADEMEEGRQSWRGRARGGNLRSGLSEPGFREDLFGGFRGGPSGGQKMQVLSNRGGGGDSLLNDSIDHYKTLGLEGGASVGAIKDAYYKLCMRVHPDKNPTLDEAEKNASLERMRNINVAYEILCK